MQAYKDSLTATISLIGQCVTETKNLKKEVVKLQHENVNLKSELLSVKQKLRDKENYNHRENLIIEGIKESSNEKP